MFKNLDHKDIVRDILQNVVEYLEEQDSKHVELYEVIQDLKKSITLLK